VVNDDGDEMFMNVQSYHMCSLMIIADARDKREIYEDVFRVFYAWGEQIATHGIPARDGEPALCPFQLTHTSDMKAQWMLSNRGGWCKTKHFFVPIALALRRIWCHSKSLQIGVIDAKGGHLIDATTMMYVIASQRKSFWKSLMLSLDVTMSAMVKHMLR